MLDISRDKVPKMETLFGLVDDLSAWKVNHLQLYVEHTFAYRKHKAVWEHASPMTAEEFRLLDAYCRDRFIELMSDKGIGTSVHYKPLHRMTYYKDHYSLNEEDFPEAERIWRGCVSLPIYPSLTNDELNYICTAIREIFEQP